MNEHIDRAIERLKKAARDFCTAEGSARSASKADKIAIDAALDGLIRAARSVVRLEDQEFEAATLASEIGGEG